MTNLFFTEDISENSGTLGTDESHHATRVLRLNGGDKILVTQGRGIIYEAEIRDISKSHTSFDILGIYKKEKRDNYLHIAMAPTKSNDRFEFFLEKATEIGVDEITPIICRHSERKIYKTERGARIIASAAKQSLSAYWPKLNEPVKFSEFNFKGKGRSGFIAHCYKTGMFNLLPQLNSHTNALVMIGPEGDFSLFEIEYALSIGLQECSLGEKRLRTETAGLAVALASIIK